MKSKEEIEQLANKRYLQKAEAITDSTIKGFIVSATKGGFIDGYTQCQEDMAKEFEKDGAKLFKSEIRRAYMHGQGNAQMMEAGLERNEIEEYVNWRMLSLNKQD